MKGEEEKRTKYQENKRRCLFVCFCVGKMEWITGIYFLLFFFWLAFGTVRTPAQGWVSRGELCERGLFKTWLRHFFFKVCPL